MVTEYIEQSTDGVRKMLSYALAIAVAISSFVLFLTAFLMSDIHRKDDFLWSAVGLFYALVLWFCARNITGAVLLGQVSASLVLISFVWQTLKLRKAVANPEQAVAISNFSVLQAINVLLEKNKKQPQVTPNSSVDDADVVTESEIAIPQTASTEVKSPASDRQATQKANKRGTFGKIFGNKKKAATNTKPDTVLNEEKVAKKATTPQEKQVGVMPPTDIKGDLQSKPDTVVEPSAEKLEIKDKEIEETNIPKQELIEKEGIKLDPPKIVEPQKPTQVESKTIDNEAIEKQTPESEKAELPVEIKPESTSVKQSQASTENITRNDSEQETEIVKTETNLESAVVSIKTVEEVEVIKPNNDNVSEQETEIVKTETNLESEAVSIKTVEEVEAIEPKTNTSNLDSLETVEVAEVLEALPENSSKERNSDRSNIIEVTTTDIEEVDEANSAKRSESDYESDL